MIVFKYPLKIDTEQTVGMPAGAKILSVQMQEDTLCMWALVNPKAPEETRRFEVIGTGVGMDKIFAKFDPEFLATVQVAPREVYHVFELRSKT